MLLGKNEHKANHQLERIFENVGITVKAAKESNGPRSITHLGHLPNFSMNTYKRASLLMLPTKLRLLVLVLIFFVCTLCYVLTKEALPNRTKKG